MAVITLPVNWYKYRIHLAMIAKPGRLLHLHEAVTTQLRVIGALVLRETMTRYGEHKIGFVWAFLEPMMLVMIVSSIFISMGTNIPGGMPIATFMITGFVPFTIFRDTMQQLQGAISSNISLMAFPQVTTFDVIVARALLEVAVLMSVFGILLLGAGALGFDIRVEDPLRVFAACGLLWVLGLGLGFIFASITPIFPSVRQVSSAVLGRPLFLSSGLFYTADTLPSELREWLLYNPILHLIELVRSAYFVEFESRYASWTYVSFWCFGVLAFGLLVHQAMRRKAVVGL